MTPEEWEKKWTRAITRAWTDNSFKERLLTNPKDALKEVGVQVPANVDVKIAEESPTVMNLTLPAKPAGAVSERELENATGGSFTLVARQYSSPWLNVVRSMPM